MNSKYHENFPNIRNLGISKSELLPVQFFFICETKSRRRILSVLGDSQGLSAPERFTKCSLRCDSNRSSFIVS